MPYLLGADEAGYGPNYGPLVISATLWEIDATLVEADLYDVLGDVVTAKAPGDDRLRVADSKALYKPRGGLAVLERSLLPLLALCGHPVHEWAALFRSLAPDCSAEIDRLPWYADYAASIPVTLKTPVADVERLERLRRAFDQVGVRLVAVRSEVVFAQRFNDLVDQHGTKGGALTELTLRLAAKMMASAPDAPMVVHCDKHGGRNKYVQKLQSVFPEHLIEVRREGREESVYRWGPATGRIEFRFVARGERFLPTALASMTSKYLRELAMNAFNAYWRRQVDDLKPTAGYPLDAKRFRRDIEPARIRLKIDERILWRSR